MSDPDAYKRTPGKPRTCRKRMITLGPGAEAAYDCVHCITGVFGKYAGNKPKYPFLDYSVCVDDYSEVCNERFLRRCVNSCGSELGATYELTQCEKMKCLMYCAKAWSPQCVAAFKERCERLTNPPVRRGDRPPQAPEDVLLEPVDPDRGGDD